MTASDVIYFGRMTNPLIMPTLIWMRKIFCWNCFLTYIQLNQNCNQRTWVSFQAKNLFGLFVSRFYRELTVFFVSNWHIRSELLTDYYWVQYSYFYTNTLNSYNNEMLLYFKNKDLGIQDCLHVTHHYFINFIVAKHNQGILLFMDMFSRQSFVKIFSRQVSLVTFLGINFIFFLCLPPGFSSCGWCKVVRYSLTNFLKEA